MRFAALTCLLIVSAALLSACGICGSNRETVERARRLPDNQLSGLFREAKVLAARHPRTLREVISEDAIPPAFRRLKPRSVYVSMDKVYLHLSGGVDDKVYIVIKDFSDSRGGRIDLLPGEGEESEVLWRGR